MTNQTSKRFNVIGIWGRPGAGEWLPWLAHPALPGVRERDLPDMGGTGRSARRVCGRGRATGALPWVRAAAGWPWRGHLPGCGRHSTEVMERGCGARASAAASAAGLSPACRRDVESAVHVGSSPRISAGLHSVRTATPACSTEGAHSARHASTRQAERALLSSIMTGCASRYPKGTVCCRWGSETGGEPQSTMLRTRGPSQSTE